MFKPLNGYVLIRKVYTAEQKTAGGILVPAVHQPDAYEGEVVATSDGSKLSEGDRVFFGRFIKTAEMDFADTTLIVAKEEDLFGVLKGAPALRIAS
jgi:chaperonin GroES